MTVPYYGVRNTGIHFNLPIIIFKAYFKIRSYKRLKNAQQEEIKKWKESRSKKADQSEPEIEKPAAKRIP